MALMHTPSVACISGSVFSRRDRWKKCNLSDVKGEGHSGHVYLSIARM